MRISAVAVLVWALTMAPSAFAEPCTFDAQGVAAQLQRIARQNPGFQPVPGKPAVQWREPDGGFVQVSYGGCVDLYAEVLLRHGPGSARAVSLDDLLSAVERYWSPAQAQAVRAARQSGQLVRSTQGDATVYEASPDEASGLFPFGFTIRLEERQATLTWPAG